MKSRVLSNPKRYVFTHTQGYTHTGNVATFASKYNLNERVIQLLLNGASVPIRGWTLVKELPD